MSARSSRERPPSGRHNSNDLFASGKIQSSSAKNNIPVFSRSNNQSSDFDFNKPISGRSDQSQLSSRDIFNRMQGTGSESVEKKQLGSFNSFARPRTSSAVPLRTIFLDPEANNFPRSKTRTELMRRIKASGTPHPSFDLDKDGYVSQQDYKLAKRFDFDGNGVLDPDELIVAKKILAEEFFSRNSTENNTFGATICNTDKQRNVTNLADSIGFERAYDKLTAIERTINSNKPLLGCLRPNLNKEILKHNFYTNKFDTTAWNDSDAIPRSANTYDMSNHGGSRKRLLFTRNEALRNEVQHKLDSMTFKSSMPNLAGVSLRRVALITNIKVENDRGL